MNLFKEEAQFLRDKIHLISNRNAELFYLQYHKIFGSIPTSVSQALIDVAGIKRLLLSHKEVILDNTFEECTGMIDLTIPGHIKEIGTSAFSKTDIAVLTLSSGVSRIENNAFYDCKDLTSVFISKSVADIGNYCFASCPSLYEIYYEGTLAEWKKITLRPMWKDGDQKISLYCDDGGLTI